jgi:hypothetical protein
LADCSLAWRDPLSEEKRAARAEFVKVYHWDASAAIRVILREKFSIEKSPRA